MKIDKINQIKIELEGNDITDFKSIINKIKTKEIGFEKKLSATETDLIDKLNIELKK